MKAFLIALILCIVAPISSKASTIIKTGVAERQWSLDIRGHAPGLYRWNVTFDRPVEVAGSVWGYFNEEVHAWGMLFSTGIMFQAYSGGVGSLTLDPPKPTYPGSPDSTWRTLEGITFTTYSGLGAKYTARIDYFAAVPEPATWLTLISGFGLTGGVLRRRKAQAALI